MSIIIKLNIMLLNNTYVMFVNISKIMFKITSNIVSNIK